LTPKSPVKPISIADSAVPSKLLMDALFPISGPARESVADGA
jgi:hypothetical protein